MSKYRLPLNLQLFAEDDDMILPDDFADTTPQDSEQPEVTQEPENMEPLEQTAEDTKPAEGQTEPQEPGENAEIDYSPLLKAISEKAKFNHGPVQVDSIDDLVANFQKGLVMDKAVERARQEAAQQARDAVIAEMGMEWNGKPIKTESEYKQAVAEQKLIEQYKDRDLPPEVIQELVENRKFREEQQREKAEKESQAQRQAQFDEFFRYFESTNDRAFDPAKDTIPPEVQAAVESGVPLKFAYMEHQNKELRSRLKIASQNQANKQKAPIGSVTANGNKPAEAEDLFLKGFNSI